MAKISWLDRIMLGRTFSLVMLGIALAIVIPVTWVEVRHGLPVMGKEEAGEPLGVYAGQGAVGIILVALGVILEGRDTFLRQVLKTYHLESLPGQEAFCDLCELFGFYILVLGLMIECFDELVKLYGFSLPWVVASFGVFSILLNLLAIAFLLRLMVLIARLSLKEVAQP